MRKRITYSQNFLKDKALVIQLINKSSLNMEDSVFEIGAGQGIITDELLNKCRKVISFEIDQNLFNKLSKRYKDKKNLDLRYEDFLSCNLPNYPYKVFSNIPFSITSLVIKKLTRATPPPNYTYLIIQKEAAKKFIGKPYDIKNSQTVVLNKPWFDFEVIHEFKRSDFFPKPNVDTVLLKITKKANPLIFDVDRIKYEDFITFTFNQFKPNISEGLVGVFGKQKINDLALKLYFKPTVKPSELNFEHWISIFKVFQEEVDQIHQNIVKDSYSRLAKQQSQLRKINRTRTDRNWRSK